MRYNQSWHARFRQHNGVKGKARERAHKQAARFLVRNGKCFGHGIANRDVLYRGRWYYVGLGYGRIYGVVVPL